MPLEPMRSGGREPPCIAAHQPPAILGASSEKVAEVPALGPWQLGIEIKAIC